MNLRVASLALASSLLASAALAQGTARSCARVEVSSVPTAAGGTRSTVVGRAPSFSATRILDLAFTVLFPPRTTGEHLVELRVFTPDAQLYRSLAVPVAAGGDENATRSVEGYARPLPQQPLKPVSRGGSRFVGASTTLPVAGTDIVSSGLYGRWRVEAYLDGAEQRCGPAASFVLNP
jgi:hypothetical protein